MLPTGICPICKCDVPVPLGDFVGFCRNCPGVVCMYNKYVSRNVTVDELLKKTESLRAILQETIDARRLLEAKGVQVTSLPLFQSQITRLCTLEERLQDILKLLDKIEPEYKRREEEDISYFRETNPEIVGLKEELKKVELEAGEVVEKLLIRMDNYLELENGKDFLLELIKEGDDKIKALEEELEKQKRKEFELQELFEGLQQKAEVGRIAKMETVKSSQPTPLGTITLGTKTYKQSKIDKSEWTEVEENYFESMSSAELDRFSRLATVNNENMGMCEGKGVKAEPICASTPEKSSSLSSSTPVSFGWPTGTSPPSPIPPNNWNCKADNDEVNLKLAYRWRNHEEKGKYLEMDKKDRQESWRRADKRKYDY